MKKTTKKLSINKETVTSFSALSGREIKEVRGGMQAESLKDILSYFGACTIYDCSDVNCSTSLQISTCQEIN